jgi:hypothetical protein
MGLDDAALQVTPDQQGMKVARAICQDAIELQSENIVQSVRLPVEEAWLRVVVNEGASCQFDYSDNGEDFSPMGEPFQAREGRWIGAKVGLFAVTSQETGLHRHADFDWFRIEPIHNLDQKSGQ